MTNIILLVFIIIPSVATKCFKEFFYDIDARELRNPDHKLYSTTIDIIPIDIMF